jgi:hypothetical protein
MYAGESNGKLPLRTCPGCSVPEPYRSPDWALVPAKPAQGLNTHYYYYYYYYYYICMISERLALYTALISEVRITYVSPDIPLPPYEFQYFVIYSSI